jgi:hypothetical protein
MLSLCTDLVCLKLGGSMLPASVSRPMWEAISLLCRLVRLTALANQHLSLDMRARLTRLRCTSPRANWPQFVGYRNLLILKVDCHPYTLV